MSAFDPRMRRFLILLCVSVSPWLARAQQPQAQQPSQQHGRLFPPQDLGLLEAPDRKIWQKPDQIMDLLGVADGSVVADFGAGSGWFTVQLARRVGPNGKVYSQDVQGEMVNAITRRVNREGLTWVVPVRGETDDPRFPRAAIGKLDAILIVGVYHEMEDRVAMLQKLAAALKPQGRIGVVDFKLQGGGPGPPMDERVDPKVVVADAATAKLRLLSQETFLPYQYLLIFGRSPADATRSAAPGSPRKP